MIICNLIGGLGNQMFQYACGRAVSLRSKQELRIATDQFDNYKLHNGFELKSVFRINTPEATAAEIKNLLGWRSNPTVRRILAKPIMNRAVGKSWFNEPSYNYSGEINNVDGSMYLHGYWQSELYFSDFADKIRDDYSFCIDWSDEDLKIRESMRMHPSASVHIRRGDYTNTKNMKVYALCGVDYYRKAINIIRESMPGIRLFVFSDDPDWVESKFRHEFGPMDVVRHNGPERSANDMRLMAEADHHIIANSSFSWWGAWLNPSSTKMVIAPKQWFVNGTDDSDLIPASWIRI